MGDMADWQLEQVWWPQQDGDYTEAEMRCMTECHYYVGNENPLRWCHHDEQEDISQCPYFRQKRRAGK